MTTLSDELTTGPLAAELAPLITAGEDGSILAVLNRKDIPGKVPIISHAIKAFFSAYGFRIPIMDSASLACRETTVNLSDFDSFDMRNPLYEAKLTSILQGLVDEPLIPDFMQEHMDYVLSLGDALKSRVEIINDGLEITALVNKTKFVPFNITIADIRAEIWNDDGSRKL
jgi:hypothetical protein